MPYKTTNTIVVMRKKPPTTTSNIDFDFEVVFDSDDRLGQMIK